MMNPVIKLLFIGIFSQIGICYNFSYECNLSDIGFVFCIKKDFEKLDEILSELKNDDRFKNIEITS